VNDATSGFFAFRRELATSVAERARGYKFLLELLAAGHGKLRLLEVPICFRDRTHGSSKLSFRHQWIYLQRLMALCGGTVTFGTASRFAAVGLFGLAVDVLLFEQLMSHGVGLALAHIMSFFTAAAVNYSLNSKWAFRAYHPGSMRWDQFSRFVTVGIFALLMRGGVLALLVYDWQVPSSLAIFPAIAATAAINYFGSAFYVFPVERNGPSPDLRWRVASLGVAIFALLLRLIYLNQAELLPDEAYYWNYAQHMDLSFLDHPPMVAWLIWLGTAVFGNTEFGVRIGAFACGLIAMGYLYALARNLYDKSTAMRTVLLLSVLPFGFASGMLMTPDAPLIAAWAATLYYMERALIGNCNWAWLGMGVAFGLGLLSKYTLGLLGIAALVFAIFDPAARRWLRRPHPYFAALLALLLFSPVIIWNMEHQWASFLFQSARRIDKSYDFSMHVLIMQILILLTPTGFLAAALALLGCAPASPETEGTVLAKRHRLFILVLTVVPLGVFLSYSIFYSMSSHLFWNGPVWLAVLPAIAWMMGQTGEAGTIIRRLQKAWKPTITIALLLYATLLHYAVLGLPWVPYPSFVMNNYFWHAASNEIEKIEADLRHSTGREPIVVGMNKFSAASALAFYDHDGGAMEVRSRNMFGGSAVMYELWHPSQLPTPQPIILVGTKQQELEYDSEGKPLERWFYQLGPIRSRMISREDIPLRHVYYRIAQGYVGKI
jgi:dolichol-phosphate mannosyltransferase